MKNRINAGFKNRNVFLKKLGTLLTTSTIVILVLTSLASAVDCGLIPHGIDGLVLRSDGVTQMPAGTNFSVHDNTSGDLISGNTGGPPPLPGWYSVPICGNDGDEVKIRAWNATHFGERTVILSGTMSGIDVIVNSPIIQALIANANGPYTGTVNVAIGFTGSATGGTSPYTSYAWEFGDGATGSVQNPSHAYTGAGTFTANLTVTDTDGTIAKNSTQIMVSLPATDYGSISGFKINDINGNGKWDAGEKGISRWNITLVGINNDGKIILREIRTDTIGFYEFVNLPAGKYIIKEENQKGWQHTISTVRYIVLKNGQKSMNNDFTNRLVNKR
ncbi:MAG: PKD domain-containing protein [Candidatus Methanoperedens sp.]|nr:PKD domain-containing protein [Candidatus Methanoperedens sp.]MCE8427866.1 PKD domain-containing protein [Candidatus Methanoperedens sp.]